MRQMNLTRRTVLRIAGGSLLAPAFSAIVPRGRYAAAAENSWRHGASEFGQLKYPAQFAHFDYVNPRAPNLEPYGKARSALTIISTSSWPDGREIWPPGLISFTNRC